MSHLLRILFALLLFTPIAFITIGVYLIHPPSALITLGVLAYIEVKGFKE